MDKAEIKEIGDDLFLYLTKQITDNNKDIDIFVNQKENGIYLCNLRNDSKAFIVHGKVVVTSDGNIDFTKSDSCLFVRNAISYKTDCINSKEIKRLIDYTNIDLFAKELKDLFLEILNNQKDKSRENTRSVFLKHKKLTQRFANIIKQGKGEELFKYAARIGKPEFYRYVAYLNAFKEIDNYINNLWEGALYSDEIDRKRIELLIIRIMNSFNSRYESILRG